MGKISRDFRVVAIINYTRRRGEDGGGSGMEVYFFLPFPVLSMSHEIKEKKKENHITFSSSESEKSITEARNEIKIRSDTI